MIFALRSLPLLAGILLLAATGAAEPLSLDQVKAATVELEKITREELKTTGIPGLAIAVVFKDKIVFAQGFGVREVGHPEPVDADTVFQIASLSKPVGSTLVALLVGEGKVTWDSRISDLDPGFAMFDPWVTSEITLKDFYAHRSGLPQHAGDLLEDMGYTREEVLQRLRFQPPNTSFRSGYAYTNFGLTEAAVAVAKAVGRTWEELSKEELYRPLGMNSTSSTHAGFLAQKNRALGHVQEKGKWVQKFQRDPDAQSPAGGVSSSVRDLAQWMRLQLAAGKFEGKQLVAPEALAETHHPQILTGMSPLDGLPQFYGLGWNVNYDEAGRLRLSHSGAFDLGAATTVTLYPSEHLGIVVLTNAYPLGVAEALGNIFLDYALRGKPTRDWLALYKQAFAQMMKGDHSTIGNYTTPPDKPTAPSPNASYTGIYANDFFGKIRIEEKDGGLTLIQGPKQMNFPLHHWNRDVFTYETTGESGIGTSGVLFTVASDGRANRVLIENLNIHGLGEFQRVAESSLNP